MKMLSFFSLLILLSSTTSGQQVELESVPLIDSPLYNGTRVRAEVIERIRAGVYDGYTADLCIDNASKCDTEPFQPFKKVVDGQTRCELTIWASEWDGIPLPVRDAAVGEIVYYTWGHPDREHPPLDVSIKGGVVKPSPLFHLARKSTENYLHFARSESLVGGVGMDAYGPNCWYNAISAIADEDSDYARSRMLKSGAWDRPRFMGPTEFRHHMTHFTRVEEPEFGDIVRYYTDKPIYGGLVFGGEIHAAVYVGKERYTNEKGEECVREIALTKNGRSDLDFLIFQDIRGMDETYLAAPGGDVPASSAFSRPKKEYFRVNRGSSLFDPAAAGRVSEAHGALQVDLVNYMDRWLCLAGLIGPPEGSGATCYSYPEKWLILPSDEPTPPASTDEPEKPRLQLSQEVAPSARAAARTDQSGETSARRALRPEGGNLAPTSARPGEPDRREFNRHAARADG